MRLFRIDWAAAGDGLELARCCFGEPVLGPMPVLDPGVAEEAAARGVPDSLLAPLRHRTCGWFRLPDAWKLEHQTCLNAITDVHGFFPDLLISVPVTPGRVALPGRTGGPVGPGSLVTELGLDRARPPPPVWHLPGVLNPDDFGIDAMALWSTAAGQGQGVRVAVVDRGFPSRSHPRLALAHAEGVHLERSHGLAMASVAAGQWNSLGYGGVAPRALVGGFSIGLTPAHNADARETALLRALLWSAQASKGGVVVLGIADRALIRRGRSLVAVETPILQARLAKPLRAVAQWLGCVVVQSGGRTGTVLSAASPTDEPVLTVGACHKDPQRGLLRESGRGPGIDCVAWGEAVPAAGPNGSERQDFGGPSAASAVVGGLAAALRGWVHFKCRTLSPQAAARVVCRSLRVASGVPDARTVPDVALAMVRAQALIAAEESTPCPSP